MAGTMVAKHSGNWRGVLERLRKADLERIRADFPDYPYPDLLRAIEASVEFLPSAERSRYLDLGIFPEDVPIPVQVLKGTSKNDAVGVKLDV